MRAFKSDRLKSAWSKLEGQATRLALVFHCVRETYLPSPGENANTISADTLVAALVWIEWLKNETRRIYYTLTHKGDTRQADKLIDSPGATAEQSPPATRRVLGLAVVTRQRSKNHGRAGCGWHWLNGASQSSLKADGQPDISG